MRHRPDRALHYAAMITAYRLVDSTLRPMPFRPGEPLPAGASWFDLADPSEAERVAIADALQLSIPTREDMLEIELSSRLYQEIDALFMTASLVTGAETDRPALEPVLFILMGTALVTVRHHDFKAFDGFVSRAGREAPFGSTALGVLLGLMDAIVDRLADILELVQREADDISRSIFGAKRPVASRDLDRLLRRIGLNHNLTTRVRESLASLERVLTFLGRPDATRNEQAVARTLVSLARDVTALTHHASYLGSNINFLLDSTLGMINIAQNAIIKIVSVAALVFLPPTLIASIYGMNFDVMPELGWPWGYPAALGLMALSAVLPYVYFRRRGWL